MIFNDGGLSMQQFGIIGLSVMGKNLALNIRNNGFSVSGFSIVAILIFMIPIVVFMKWKNMVFILLEWVSQVVKKVL